MNAFPSPAGLSELPAQLRGFVLLCNEVLTLTGNENQALTAPDEYQPFEFFQGRKALLLKLDQALNLLPAWRRAWQQVDPAEREKYPEVKALIQTAQDALVRILQLDRENQQALLRRGLLPARHVPTFAAQQPHFASRLYRRYAAT
jgi:hypothetical protein